MSALQNPKDLGVSEEGHGHTVIQEGVQELKDLIASGTIM